MATIYLSSTSRDLKEHREAVYHALRRMRHDVVAMEDYVATEHRPLEKCLQDVVSCDLYIGLFAWRYGHIPTYGNPDGKSITELEYRQAKTSQKPCLIFLLAKDAMWSPQEMDAFTGESEGGQSIRAFREALTKGELVSSFRTAEELASLVSAAVSNWERTTREHAHPRPVEHLQDNKQQLKLLFADHSGFLHDRLASFVGRQAELVEIQQRIAATRSTGGYVTITGQAGQGKSSIIAKLVEEAISQQGEESVAYHFIPFNPGPDYQIGLLRNLIARLVAKYNLSELFVASESRPALRDYFPRVLKEVAEQEGQEVIFIDGLDQLEAENNGERDLSFLPNNPPAGIVFVLGTRPNDTLSPLKLLKSHYVYSLPPLSRKNFALVLQHRSVQLESDLADVFYQKMHQNALYLDLVAKELREQGALSPLEIINRVTDDPENIFTVTIRRLKRQQPVLWHEVIKRILGILLVAGEALASWQIRQILQIDDERLREGFLYLVGHLPRAVAM